MCTRSCVPPNDVKIVHSRDAQCRGITLREKLKKGFLKYFCFFNNLNLLALNF